MYMANSKLSGEYLIRAILEKFYILRLSGIYGKNICMEKGYNFVDKILKTGEEKGEVKVVDDEILTPTFTEEIAAQIVHMISKKMPNSGSTMYQRKANAPGTNLHKEIFKIKNNGVKVNKALPGEFSGGVLRPAYSVLENKHLKDQGLNIMTDWKQA